MLYLRSGNASYKIHPDDPSEKLVSTSDGGRTWWSIKPKLEKNTLQETIWLGSDH